MKGLKKWLGMGICSLLILLITIFLLNFILILPAPFNIKVAQNNDWIGFYGGFIGAMLGGIVTLTGIFLTIKHERKRDEENNRLGLLPYCRINYVYDKYNDKHNARSLILGALNNQSEKHIFKGHIVIENLGLNSAIDFKLFDILIDGKAEGVSITTSILEVKEELIINLLIELPRKALTEITEENKHTYAGIHKLFIKIGFCDLLENYYEQLIEINCSIGLKWREEGPLNAAEYTVHAYLADISKVKIK